MICVHLTTSSTEALPTFHRELWFREKHEIKTGFEISSPHFFWSPYGWPQKWVDCGYASPPSVLEEPKALQKEWPKEVRSHLFTRGYPAIGIFDGFSTNHLACFSWILKTRNKTNINDSRHTTNAYSRNSTNTRISCSAATNFDERSFGRNRFADLLIFIGGYLNTSPKMSASHPFTFTNRPDGLDRYHWPAPFCRRKNQAMANPSSPPLCFWSTSKRVIILWSYINAPKKMMVWTPLKNIWLVVNILIYC